MRHSKHNLGRAIGTIVLISSLATTALCGDPQSENREALTKDLTNLAIRAQDYYRRSVWEGGGGGTFTGLTTNLNGLKKLTAKSITPNGRIDISYAGNATSIGFRGVGTQVGNNGNLILVTIIVFADSMALTYAN